MARSDNPFDARRRLGGCSCGAHADQAAHEASLPSGDAAVVRVVEAAMLRALFPHDAGRRAFLKSVGAATAAAAVAQFLPTQFVAEAFAEAGRPERADLKVGFIPITCATPIIRSRSLSLLPSFAAAPDRSCAMAASASCCSSLSPLALRTDTAWAGVSTATFV